LEKNSYIDDAAMLAGVGLAASRAAIHAVRVQIIPAPRSLVDSREILRILQSYGEVTTYRWLKVCTFERTFKYRQHDKNIIY
jgi:hypothetical protein